MQLIPPEQNMSSPYWHQAQNMPEFGHILANQKQTLGMRVAKWFQQGGIFMWNRLNIATLPPMPSASDRTAASV